MKKILSIMALSVLLSLATPVFAAGTHGTDGHVSARSVGASLCSLLVWPGI